MTEEKDKRENVWRTRILGPIVLMAVVLLLSAFFAVSFFWPAVIIVVPIGLIAGSIWLIYFYLAPNNRFFTFVHEATGRFVSKGGQVSKVLIQWEGHTFDDDGNVVPTNKWVKGGKELDVVKELDKETGKLKIKKKEAKKRSKKVKKQDSAEEDQDEYFYEYPEEDIEGAKRYEEVHYPLGGLRYYGFWPIYTIYFYDFSWTGVDQAGKIDPHPKESLGFFVLTDDNYLLSANALETKPPENLPVNIPLPITIRIANPRKAIFAAERWLEITLQAINSVAKDFVGAHTYEQLLSEKDIGEQIMMIAEERKIIEELFNRYGIEVRRIRALDVVVAEAKDAKNDLQRATLRAFEAEQTAKATVITAKAESQKRAQEAMGSIILMMAEATGEKAEDIQAKIKNSPRLRSQVQKFIQDLAVRQVSITGKSLLDIRVEGAEGIERTLLNLISAYRRISSGTRDETERKDRADQDSLQEPEKRERKRR